jgi:hypothetical protein
VLLFELSTPQYKGLSYTWTCLDSGSLCCSYWNVYPQGPAWVADGRVCTTDSCAAPGRVSSKGPWAAPGCVCTKVACAAPGLIYTTETCAAPGAVYTLGPEPHQDVSALQILCCTSTGFLYRALSCTWLCLHNSRVCCSWTYLHYRVLCCTRICPHIGAGASPGSVCTTDSGAALRPVYTLQGLSSTGTCLHNRVLCCTWTGFLYRAQSAPGCVRTTIACAAPGIIYTTETLGPVYTLGPELHLGVSTLQIPLLH